MVNLENFLKTWSLRSNSVTRQGTFNRTKNWWKMPKFKKSNETFWMIFKHCEWGSWMNQWQNATRLKGCVIILRFLPVNRKIQFYFKNVIWLAFCHIFFFFFDLFSWWQFQLPHNNLSPINNSSSVFHFLSQLRNYFYWPRKMIMLRY